MISLMESLRDAIRNSELSISELGRRAGVSKSGISNFMSYKGGLSLDSADAIGKVLNWPAIPRLAVLINGPRSWRICRIKQLKWDAGVMLSHEHLKDDSGESNLEASFWGIEPISPRERPDYALARLHGSDPTSIKLNIVPKTEQQ